MHPEGITHILEHHPEIRRFRAHQDLSGNVTLKLEVRAALGPADLARVRSRLSRQLGGRTIQIEIVDSLPPGRAGKHRWITSELAASLSRLVQDGADPA